MRLNRATHRQHNIIKLKYNMLDGCSSMLLFEVGDVVDLLSVTVDTFVPTLLKKPVGKGVVPVVYTLDTFSDNEFNALSVTLEEALGKCEETLPLAFDGKSVETVADICVKLSEDMEEDCSVREVA